MSNGTACTTSFQAQEKNIASSDPNLSGFFLICYICMGVSCAHFGIIGQPVQYYLMSGLGLGAAQVSSYMGILMIPWIIKPVYGLLSDFIPFLGYRKKSYLTAAGIISAISFLVAGQCASAASIVAYLAITGFCMAMTTVLMVALAVERGRQQDLARDYFRIQELGYYGANIAAVILAGIICQSLAPSDALAVAALAASIPAIILAYMCARKLDEKKNIFSISQAGIQLKSLGNALLARNFILAAALAGCWCFTLSTGVPLYFHECKTLRFSQAFIGQLSAWSASGMLLGALVYKQYDKSFKNGIKLQLLTTAAAICASTLSYFWLSSHESAVLIELFRGSASMLGILCVYSLAARNCPNGLEASLMAILVAVLNSATNLSVFMGGYLFEHVFYSDFPSLLRAALIAPLISVFLILAFMRKPTSINDAT